MQANIAAQATAEKRAALERNFELFPEFLRQLRPTMVSLGALSEEMLPVFTDIEPVASDVSRILIALGPFSRAGIPALRSLGQTVETGGPALQEALPTVKVLGSFTARARNASQSLASFLTSFDQTKGIRYLTNTIFNLAMSVNGFDDFGHYLRTTLLAGCNSQATILNQACSANFVGGGSAGAGTATASRTRNVSERRSAGENPKKVLADYRRTHGGKLPQGTAPSLAKQIPAPTAKAAPKKSKPRTDAPPKDGMLYYLLGNGG